jgi:2-polyprenyl-6-methoxyphenol hydroxylase-like FAD-dependent oxidoreductase
MYDVIIVGARCAGAPTAMLLARRGHRVLLCDRAAFPSDTVSNGMFNSPGPRYLHRWGLLERLRDTGVPPVHCGTTFVFGQQFRTDYPSPTYAPRRTVLDHLLVEAALEAGAELRERCHIVGLLEVDGRVSGVRAVTTRGAEVRERARLVIGADGRRSMMAYRFGAQVYAESPAPISGGVLTYYENLPINGYEFWAGGPAGLAILAPTGDGLTHVSTFGSVAGTPREQFDSVLSSFPELQERLRGGTRVTKLVAYRESPLRLRQASGPGWALVGDASFHSGPFGGYGMSHAFRDADTLADALDDWLSGRAGYEPAMARYVSDHDAWANAFFDLEVSTFRAYAEGRQPPSPAALMAKWLSRIDGEQVTD